MIRVWNLEKAEWVDHKLPEGILDETIFAANAPDYMCLTGPRYTPNVQLKTGDQGDDDWLAKQLAREAKEIEIQERRRILEDIKHLARLKRKEIKQREKAELHALSKERQKKPKARMAPDQLKESLRQRAVKVKATWDRKRKAAGKLPHTGGKRSAREMGKVPVGYTTMPELVRKTGRSRTGLWEACIRGQIEYLKGRKPWLIEIESANRYLAASQAASDRLKKGKRG